MISHGPGFVLRHSSGRYYRSDLIHFGHRVSYAPGTYAVVHALMDSPFEATLIYSPAPWERHLETVEWAGVAGQFEIVPGPGCGCCGERRRAIWGGHGHWRCEKHKDRNPCAIEGCKRTTDRKGAAFRDDQWLCSEHWKRYVPARSRERRLYHKHHSRAKRLGWDDARLRSFWRFWDALILRVRARATEGHLDEAEINRLFGWNDPGVT